MSDVRLIVGLAMLVVSAFVTSACSDHLPEWQIECGDGTYFSSHKGMPDSRLCRNRGGVVNSITIVEGPKRSGR